MSLFKSLLFTQESRRHGFELDNEGVAFGPTYGNQIANEKQFREPWDPHRPDPSSLSIDAGEASGICGCG